MILLVISSTDECLVAASTNGYPDSQAGRKYELKKWNPNTNAVWFFSEWFSS